MSEPSTAPTVAPAESSPAPSFEVPRSGTPEYAEWRLSGKLPEKSAPVSEDSASSDSSKETLSAPAGESETPSTQENRLRTPKPKQSTEERFRVLTEHNRQLKAELDAARAKQQTPEAESSPAAAESKPVTPNQPPENYAEWRKAFKPSQWVEAYAKANPEASYEDANAAMADYLGDARAHFTRFEQQQSETKARLEADVEKARSRYEKFDEVRQATVDAIIQDNEIPVAIKARISRSANLADLIFKLGSDPAKLAEFVTLTKTDQDAARERIAVMEHQIAEELTTAKPPASNRNDKGQFQAEAPPPPAKRGPESAPEPPIEIGHRGAGTMDAEQRAFERIQRGDAHAVRDWMKAANEKDMRRRRGV